MRLLVASNWGIAKFTEILRLDTHFSCLYNKNVILRSLKQKILAELEHPEVVIVNGPRRVGKTTLIKSLQDSVSDRKTAYFDFTDPAMLNLWRDFSVTRIESIISELGMRRENCILFFDEVQYLEQPGLLLKLLYDHFQNIKVIATGSSSFLLLQHIGDSLAGRKKIFVMYPLSLSEISLLENTDYWKFSEMPVRAVLLTEVLRQTLLYGAYPPIYLASNKDEKIEKLREIADSYLFKDLLSLEHIKNPRIIVELTRLLSYQIGSLVNPNELAVTLGVARDTVMNYIDLLEKFFIVFRVYPYEQNLRDVIKHKFKVYFFDLGIRNAVIGNFTPLSQRGDRGYLLENAVAIGIRCRIEYDRKLYKLYFWRDYDGNEVDLVIKNEKSYGVEVKMERSRARISKTFHKVLPLAKTMIIDMNNAYKMCL